MPSCTGVAVGKTETEQLAVNEQNVGFWLHSVILLLHPRVTSAGCILVKKVGRSELAKAGSQCADMQRLPGFSSACPKILDLS